MPRDWNWHYQRNLGELAPVFVVQGYGPLLPDGPVLDLAGGAGRNALYLAGRGHPVILLDKSSVALEQARREAQANNLPVWGVEMDLENGQAPLPPGPLAGVVMSLYVHRPLLGQLAERLIPGGLVLIEGFSTLEARKRGSTSPWYWKPGELLSAPEGLGLRAFGEGWQNGQHRSWAVWQKPHSPF